jgi:hypothetical protein
MRSSRLSEHLAPHEAIDLYLELSSRLEDGTLDTSAAVLSGHQAALLVRLIEAWRSLEHRKHLALKHALARAERRKTPSPDVRSRWYAVRLIFHHADVGAYEERVTLWRAESAEAAIDLAEEDGRRYTSALEDVQGTGLAQVYWLADRPGHGAEVFSLMRDSKRLPDDYVATFFDTGAERQNHVSGS